MDGFRVKRFVLENNENEKLSFLKITLEFEIVLWEQFSLFSEIIAPNVYHAIFEFIIHETVSWKGYQTAPNYFKFWNEPLFSYIFPSEHFLFAS